MGTVTTHDRLRSPGIIDGVDDAAPSVSTADWNIIVVGILDLRLSGVLCTFCFHPKTLATLQNTFT